MATLAPPSPARLARETQRLLSGSLDRLNFGCGASPLPGWTNIDNGDGEWYSAPELESVIKLDLFEALRALPDACASCVYSEHMFEHFTLEQGHAILRDWFRVLKPGGVVRIVCPDLAAEAKLFLRQLAPAPDDVIDRHRLKWLADRYRFQPGERLTRAMVLNYGMWLDGHKFVYDAETLTQSLTLAGFASVVRESFGRSSHAALRAIDTHDGGETGRSWIPSIALVMEATKPGAAAHGLIAPCEPFVKPAPPAAHPPVDRAPALARRLIEVTADLCAARGFTRIALYGGGRHTEPIAVEPWRSRGVQVVVILDDSPKVAEIRGVPVCTPDALSVPIDAVVVSSDAHEDAIAAAAARRFTPRGIPIVRIYGERFAAP